MTAPELLVRLREVAAEALPLPGHGATAARHRRLMEVGREDLSFAKLAEAHWDAMAILAEAGCSAVPGALYAVWASEVPGEPLRLVPCDRGYSVSGRKAFCSGAGLVDRALVTVQTAGNAPEQRLVEIDLRLNAERLQFDGSAWATEAFRLTQTGAVTFASAAIGEEALVGGPGWYLERPGFWHGACGPAACWAGGAGGLLHAARASRRDDPHTLAHLGAMEANVWALEACLQVAGEAIDRCPQDRAAAHRLALQVRHLVEVLATDVLRRFARAYGPFPLAMNADTARRYAELDLFLRQSHAERDLEVLGRLAKSQG